MGKKKHRVGRVSSWGSLDARLHVSVSYGKGDMPGGVFKYSWASELAFCHRCGNKAGLGGGGWRQRPDESLIDGEGIAQRERA